MKKIIIVVCILLGLLTFNASKSDPFIQPDTYEAYNIAVKTLDVVDRRDYKSLSKYIHPEQGVIFTPFSYVNYDEDLVFSSEQVRKFANDNSKYTWGCYNQNSMPIELTVNDYFEQFVYDKAYLYVDQIAINNIIMQGNSVENVKEVFTDCVFVDFYHAGSEEYEGLDWSSLKIVMEKYKGEFKIVAIIHSCYTL